MHPARSNTWRTKARVLGFSLLVLLGARPPADPLETLKVTLTEAQAITTRGGPHNEKLDALKSLMRGILDIDTMGRQALRNHLRERPVVQQEEFLQLFQDLIVRGYLQKLLLFRNPDFAYTKQDINGKDAKVYTKILTAKDEFYVDYQMRRSEGQWLVTDIVVEHVSLVRNYGNQFNKLLQTLSFEELLDRMRRKVGKLKATNIQ